MAFTAQPAWTRDISHGELLRDGYDETLTIDLAQLRFLYQGVSPDAAGLPYNSLPGGWASVEPLAHAYTQPPVSSCVLVWRELTGFGHE